MTRALAKRSDFLKVKSKFFINRIVMYFSFLLIPIWIQQSQQLNFFLQATILLMYMGFMISQWYLLGKEIDHRLKIYYRVNSSMERIVYRVFLGSMGMLIFFNIICLFPEQVLTYLFWGFFGILGLFYSWPTRGKIIEDSMTHQFGELKFLDSFERTVFLLCVITFMVSLPELALFENIDALKLYFDPGEKVGVLLWNYLSILYYPFSAHPKLYNLIWSFHFYFIGMGLFAVAFYGLLRHFFSRRLSILGLFSVLSSWSFAKILSLDFFASLTTTVPLLWTWCVLWSTRSGTYRSGFFTGLMVCFATLVNIHNIVLLPVTLLLFHFVLFKNQTPWFRKQWLKYNILGCGLAILIFMSRLNNLEIMHLSQLSLLGEILREFIYRKAFFVIAPVGMIMSFVFIIKKLQIRFTSIQINIEKFKELMFCLLAVLFMGLFINAEFIRGFGLIWALAFFSLLPLEWIFQSISRLRSKRNLIYALYILVCLLDSHLENRIRIIAKIFLDEESLKFLIQL